MSVEHNQLAFDFTYSNILNELSKNYNPINDEVVEKLKNQIHILEKFSFNKNRYFLLFDLAQFVPIYLSKNITSHCPIPESFYQLQLIDSLKLLHHNHINLGIKYLKWQDKFYSELQIQATNNDQFIIGGIKFKSKKKSHKTFVIKGRLLAQEKESNPRLCFLEVVEITKLWKGNIYWIQYSAERDKQLHRKIYFSTRKIKEAQHLLSPQELKIIQLVAQNKTSAEIAKLLAVNIETIKKHRKNMIAKTQTKDMTSLIQLFAICDMI